MNHETPVKNTKGNSRKKNRKIKGAVTNIYLLFNKKITFIMARRRRGKIEKLI